MSQKYSNVFKNASKFGVVAVALAGAAQVARADIIPYPNIGAPNPYTYTFTASQTGDVIGYWAGTAAGFSEEVGLMINGVLSPSGYGLAINVPAPLNFGDSFNFGHVNAGDTLVFVDHILSDGGGYVYSDSSLNGPWDNDGHVDNHVYSVAYDSSSGLLGSIPSGTYVAFEDLPFPSSDFNYYDDTFVFTDVSASVTAVPEPTTMISGAMLLLPFGASALRKLRKKASA